MTTNETIITIAGNTTAAPELRFDEGGRAWATVTVMVNHRYRDTRTREWKDGARSPYHVKVSDDAAQHLADSVGKGDRLIVTGRHEQRTYETESGEKGYAWQLVASEIGVSLAFATATPVRASKTTEPATASA